MFISRGLLFSSFDYFWLLFFRTSLSYIVTATDVICLIADISIVFRRIGFSVLLLFYGDILISCCVCFNICSLFKIIIIIIVDVVDNVLIVNYLVWLYLGFFLRLILINNIIITTTATTLFIVNILSLQILFLILTSWVLLCFNGKQ